MRDTRGDAIDRSCGRAVAKSEIADQHIVAEAAHEDIATDIVGGSNGIRAISAAFDPVVAVTATQTVATIQTLHAIVDAGSTGLAVVVVGVGSSVGLAEDSGCVVEGDAEVAGLEVGGGLAELDAE